MEKRMRQEKMTRIQDLFNITVGYIINILIIFLIRELIVMLYSHTPLVGNTLIGFAVLLLALGIVRTMAVIFSPQEDLPPGC